MTEDRHRKVHTEAATVYIAHGVNDMYNPDMQTIEAIQAARDALARECDRLGVHVTFGPLPTGKGRT